MLGKRISNAYLLSYASLSHIPHHIVAWLPLMLDDDDVERNADLHLHLYTFKIYNLANNSYSTTQLTLKIFTHEVVRR